MVKRKELAAEAKKPIAGPELTADTTTEMPIAKTMGHLTFTAANLMATSPGRLLQDQRLKNALSQDSVELYGELNPRNAQESIICMLTVGITNATLDCLSQASHLNVDQDALRDLNLRHAFKGAAVASDLIKALNDLRGEKPEKVKISNVNVEAGGRAIVGNIETSGPTKGRQEK